MRVLLVVIALCLAVGLGLRAINAPFSDPGIPRDGHGRILRSQAAKSQFKRRHPCPATGLKSGACPGYVIDHITPLACGGADAPANMQWQTIAEGKAKDKWERRDCEK